MSLGVFHPNMQKLLLKVCNLASKKRHGRLPYGAVDLLELPETILEINLVASSDYTFRVILLFDSLQLFTHPKGRTSLIPAHDHHRTGHHIQEIIVQYAKYLFWN